MDGTSPLLSSPTSDLPPGNTQEEPKIPADGELPVFRGALSPIGDEGEEQSVEGSEESEGSDDIDIFALVEDLAHQTADATKAAVTEGVIHLLSGQNQRTENVIRTLKQIQTAIQNQTPSINETLTSTVLDTQSRMRRLEDTLRGHTETLSVLERHFRFLSLTTERLVNHIRAQAQPSPAEEAPEDEAPAADGTGSPLLTLPHLVADMADINDESEVTECATEDVATAEPPTEEVAATTEPTIEEAATTEPTTDDAATAEPTTEDATTIESTAEDATTTEPTTEDAALPPWTCEADSDKWKVVINVPTRCKGPPIIPLVGTPADMISQLSSKITKQTALTICSQGVAQTVSQSERKGQIIGKLIQHIVDTATN